MTWRDAVDLAATSVRRRFGRAVLTVLAVALAAALLTALLTIAGTARTRVLDQLAKGGPLAGIKVAAAEPDPRQLDSDNPRPGDPKDLNQATLEQIRGLQGVSKVLPVVAARVAVMPPSEGQGAPRRQRDRGFWFDTMVGVELDKAEQLPITVLEGRLPLPTSRTEVAVTQDYLERLGIEKPEAGVVVGTEVQVGAARAVRMGERTRFQGQWSRRLIVGVVAQEAANGELLVPLAEATAARDWSRQSTADLGRRFEVPTSDYTGLFVVAAGLNRVSEVRNRITEIGYSTSAPENLIASVERYLKVVEIVLSAIGLIALVIAALGIANAMLAAIRERRREIGVLKAIGARDRDVLRVFLLEAAVLGFVGGVLGTTVGWVIARTVGSIVNGYLTAQGLQGVQLPLPVELLAGAVVGSTLLALAAGAIPARKAARLPAREAVGAL